MSIIVTQTLPVRRIHLPSIGSTNAEALARAHAGDPGPLWVSADRQVSGRGRGGRNWVSEPGNLYASLLLVDPAPTDHLSDLPILAAVALARAIETLVGKEGLVRLKWPNDLLIDGAKLSGILLESTNLDAGLRAVVIGFGVNCRHHPDAADYPTTSLAAEGLPSDPEVLFEALDRQIGALLTIWNRGRGFAAILSAWRDRAVGVGEPIRVRLSDRTLSGRFEDIDPAGRLILREPSGSCRKISAGDVFFAPAQDEGRAS